jgi:hypothetical protein
MASVVGRSNGGVTTIHDGRLPEEQPGLLWDPGLWGERVSLSAHAAETQWREAVERGEDPDGRPLRDVPLPEDLEVEKVRSDEGIVAKVLSDKLLDSRRSDGRLASRLRHANEVMLSADFVDSLVQAMAERDLEQEDE